MDPVTLSVVIGAAYTLAGVYNGVKTCISVYRDTKYLRSKYMYKNNVDNNSGAQRHEDLSTYVLIGNDDDDDDDDDDFVVL